MALTLPNRVCGETGIRRHIGQRACRRVDLRCVLGLGGGGVSFLTPLCLLSTEEDAAEIQLRAQAPETHVRAQREATGGG